MHPVILVLGFIPRRETDFTIFPLAADMSFKKIKELKGKREKVAKRHCACNDYGGSGMLRVSGFCKTL